MQCYELVIPRSRATARPYGSRPHRRNWPENKHFLFQSQLFLLHARVRVGPPPPGNSANLLRSNQLATLLNYWCNKLAHPDSSASLRRREASPTDSPPQLLTRSRKNMVCQKGPWLPHPASTLAGPAAPPLLARARVGTT